MQHLALSAGFCCLPQGQEQEQQEARRQQAGAQEARGTHQEALAPISHEAGIFTSQSAVCSQNTTHIHSTSPLGSLPATDTWHRTVRPLDRSDAAGGQGGFTNAHPFIFLRTLTLKIQFFQTANLCVANIQLFA